MVADIVGCIQCTDGIQILVYAVCVKRLAVRKVNVIGAVGVCAVLFVYNRIGFGAGELLPSPMET